MLVYIVTITFVFGVVEQVIPFLNKEDAENYVLDWSNKNAPESLELFVSSREALDWMENNSNRMEGIIQMFETEIQ